MLMPVSWRKKWDLIALDEMGYVPLAEVGAEMLFQVIAGGGNSNLGVNPRKDLSDRNRITSRG
jgi:hypothetical protein